MGEETKDWRDFYGPVVLGGGRTLTGDEAAEAAPFAYKLPKLDLTNAQVFDCPCEAFADDPSVTVHDCPIHGHLVDVPEEDLDGS